MRAAIRILLFAILVCTSGCGPTAPVAKTGVHTGTWRMELDLLGDPLPFNFSLKKEDNGAWVAHVHNGAEDIRVDDVEIRSDSFLLRMPLFDSEFRGVLLNDSTIKGEWFNYLKGPQYHIPFVASAHTDHRFPGPSNGKTRVTGTWETHFSMGTDDAYNAIGLFEQHDNGRATGTFLTETGDYRYLEGIVHNDSLKLSCFDGSHAFLFLAALKGDSLVGSFRSGNHWEEPWVATRNDAYALQNPDSLTSLREGYEMVDFRFPDLDGQLVSPTDPLFKGKALMVQIMGSWCPNCVDETNLLNDLYGTYKDKGLEVIAIAFERYPDTTRAMAGLRHFQRTLGVRHTLLYGGVANKENTAEKLPFLDHIMSYPTCIFVDRNGKVRRIRTGFYGPSTGEHYVTYKRNLDAFVQQLLEEPIAHANRVALR